MGPGLPRDAINIWLSQSLHDVARGLAWDCYEMPRDVMGCHSMATRPLLYDDKFIVTPSQSMGAS